MSTFKKFTFICFLAGTLITGFILGTAYGQPYIYTFETYFDEEMGYISDIYRKDLQTGHSELFAERFGRILNILLTPDQEYLFVQRRHGSVTIVEIEGEGFEELWDVGWLHFVVDASQVNRIFLGIGDDDGPLHLLVIDRISLEVIEEMDNIGLDFISINPNDKPFLSEDQSILFDQVGSLEGIFFKKTNTATLDMSDEYWQCGDMGPFDRAALLQDGKNGKALLIFRESSGYTDQYYITCNVESSELGDPLLFPWRSRAYLSSDAEHMIIEVIERSYEDFRPDQSTGSTYIFETSTGRLTQRLQFPPEGKLLLFDHYPDQIFYNVDDGPAIQIDVYHVMNNLELLEDLMEILDEAYNDGWITNSGIYRSLQANLDNVQRHLEQNRTQPAINNLRAFLNEVEAIREQHLTPEAYALLKFNGEYLFEKLQEE